MVLVQRLVRLSREAPASQESVSIPSPASQAQHTPSSTPPPHAAPPSLSAAHSQVLASSPHPIAPIPSASLLKAHICEKLLSSGMVRDDE